MAISPPSDLVLDVVRAADPMQVQIAQEKLKANRAAFRATSLADAGNGFSAILDKANSASFDAGVTRTAHEKINPADVPKVYRDYEGVFLQNFMKSMMPSDSEDVYGKGLSGDMWKGMMAEQIGNAVSKAGGVGIAEQMYAQAVRNQHVNNDQAASDESGRQAVLSMVTDLERRTFGVANEDNDKSSRA